MDDMKKMEASKSQNALSDYNAEVLINLLLQIAGMISTQKTIPKVDQLSLSLKKMVVEKPKHRRRRGFYMNDDVYEALKYYASQNGVTMSYLHEYILRKALFDDSE